MTAADIITDTFLDAADGNDAFARPSSSPPPIDTTRREHIATVRDIRFRSQSADGFTIVALAADASTPSYAAKGLDEAQELVVGGRYRFLGRWEIHDTHGPQFKFDTFVVHEPATRTAIVTYLVKLCDDIGERKANRLFAAYGADTCQILREQPERAVTDGILSEAVAASAAKELRRASQYEATKLELFDLVAGRGFPGTLIDAAIGRWGAKAGAAIRRNPFAMLVAELPGCGFKRCDKMWLDGKHPANALKRQFLCMWNDLRTNSIGHTWHRVERVIDTLRSTVPGEVNPRRALQLGIRAGWLARHRDADGQLWIAEAEKAGDEARVAQAVARLLASGEPK